ncbi:MAG: (2Fe-2S)-binding protein [Pseudomonadota bacterium]|nr:(2Fe-2S)-binding protein [Pseudomonadota bacterium]MEE3117387.1 (2Fe-2S)-binding protein [Pseudomonadota bacterium]
MPIALDPGQRAELAEHCLLQPATACDPAWSLPAVDLLDPDSCRALLDRLGPVIGSPNRYITASLLAKRLAFLTTGLALYGMSVLDRGLDLALANWRLDYRHQDGLWRSQMPLLDQRASTPQPGAREAWRASVVQTLFTEGLAPLWQSLHQSARVPLPVLWENTAVRVYSLYEKRLTAERHPARQGQIRADFHWLVEQAPAAVFGASHNPLQRFFRSRQPATARPGTRVRKTCCFYYRATEPETYCGTCPLPHARCKRQTA